MKNKYLTERERYQIEAMLLVETPIKEIAKKLGRALSTIYREIHLGTVELLDSDLVPYRKYCADTGQRIQDERSLNKGRELKIGNDMEFVRFIENMVLEKKYSPAAILAYMESAKLRFSTSVCFKTIYNYIHSGVFLNLTRNNLPMPRKKMQSIRVKKRIARNHISHTSIEERPRDVFLRLQYGHWELDTVESGKGDSTSLIVFTERMTREELIYKVPKKSQVYVLKILDQLERALTAPIFRETFKSITVDNGFEFIDQDAIEKSKINKKLKRTKVYYCHPYNAGERGSNENANKLIRRWIPKGCSIKEFSDQYIQDLQDWINDYPRKIFGYLSAREYKRLVIV